MGRSRLEPWDREHAQGGAAARGRGAGALARHRPPGTALQTNRHGTGTTPSTAATATGQDVGLRPRQRGTPVPDTVRHRTEARLRRFAEQHFAGRYTRLDVRFRGPFCYVDACTEPEPPAAAWPPPDWPETRDAYLERLRATSTHRCRLRSFADEERWGFAFSTDSNERYEPSVFPSGEFAGPPEEAFRVAAEAYLR
jgi:hypothetical protein